MVRLPQHILEANKRINQVRAELAAKDGYGRMIPDEEVAALLGISAAKVAFYTKVCAMCLPCLYWTLLGTCQKRCWLVRTLFREVVLRVLITCRRSLPCSSTSGLG